MIWFWLAVLVVLVVAVLLIWVYQAARGIRLAATRALAAAGEVEKRTQPLWAILDVNNALTDAYGVVGAIAGKAKAAADAVAPEAPKGGQA